jgi:hypothetical protein
VKNYIIKEGNFTLKLYTIATIWKWFKRILTNTEEVDFFFIPFIVTTISPTTSIMIINTKPIAVTAYKLGSGH